MAMAISTMEPELPPCAAELEVEKLRHRLARLENDRELADSVELCLLEIEKARLEEMESPSLGAWES